MTNFQLHHQLKADTIYIKDLEICTVRLMNDSTYPWVILVPKRPNKKEIFELSQSEQDIVNREISTTAKTLNHHFKAEKMNIATLGNMVPQLHIHVIARHKTDPTFPAPVWGNTMVIPYTEAELQKIVEVLRDIL